MNMFAYLAAAVSTEMTAQFCGGLYNEFATLLFSTTSVTCQPFTTTSLLHSSLLRVLVLFGDAPIEQLLNFTKLELSFANPFFIGDEVGRVTVAFLEVAGSDSLSLDSVE